MQESTPWIRFKYRHVFLFFITMTLLNYLGMVGMEYISFSRQLLFFLINAIGGALMLNVLILVFNDYAKTSGQKIKTVIWVSLMSIICSYVVIYNGMA